MTKKTYTDEQIFNAYNSGVPVAALAAHCETSRGHIYNRISRHKDPVKFKDRQAKYELKRQLTK